MGAQVSWLVLVATIPLLAAGAVAVWRRPLLVVPLFLVGLALHTAVVFLLFLAGVEGRQLQVVQAWKEILLAAALLPLALRALRARRLPFAPRPLDLVLAVFVLVALAYFLLPQHLLGGSSDLRARAYSLRELALPAAAYFLGRGLRVPAGGFARAATVLLATSVLVAAIGIVEVYAVPLEVWRNAHAARFFTAQLDYPPLHGPAGLPENFVLNTSGGVFRRLVSTDLSPLATSYMLAVALLVAAAAWPRAGRRRRLLAGAALVVLAALLLALSRSTLVALVVALVLLAVALRRRPALVAAGVVLAAGLAVAAGFGSVAPRSHFFPEDEAYQTAHARAHGGLAPGSPLTTTRGLSDPSSEEHLSELRRGFRNFLDHPGGYGLGNGGQNSLRFGGRAAAGESQYLIVAVQTGAAGLAALAALLVATLATLLGVARRAGPAEVRVAAAVLLAAQALVFAIGVQTEIWAVPWIVYVLWLGTGAVLGAAGPVRAPAAGSAAVADELPRSAVESAA